MTRFRMVLLILLVAVVIYTIPVVMAFGLTPLLPNFFFGNLCHDLAGSI